MTMFLTPNLQVEEAASQAGAVFQLLSAEQTTLIRDTVEQRFAEPSASRNERLCERLAEPYEFVSAPDEVDWHIEEFVDQSKLYMLFDSLEEPSLTQLSYAFDKGRDAINVLNQCGFFTYYLTNEDFDYLIAYSEEQYLFFCGSALTWILKKLK